MARDPRRPKPPKKPYPDFPLFPHATGRWAKKINGRTVYFGPWADADGALARYLDRRDDLYAGRTPGAARPASGPTVRDLLNDFLTSRKARLDVGELSPQTWVTYRTTCDEVGAAFGLRRAQWDWAFARIGQFLERGGVRQQEQGALTYRVYHETFREFLRGRLASDLPDAHRRWAEYGLRWRDLSGYARVYALRHLPGHLIAASRGA